MRYLLSLAILLAACGKDASGPTAFVDPPAAVHVINQAGQPFQAWTIVIGPDAAHSGIANQGDSDPIRTTPLCLATAQVHAERQFIEAAVALNSSLDTLLRSVSNKTPTEFTAWADSLARGLLTPAGLLASHPGLIVATAPFDPAPVGFAFPPDTVPWRWTVNPSTTSIAVDTSDHACVRRG